MDTKNLELTQLKWQNHLGQLVERKKYGIRQFLRNLPREQLEELFELALPAEHLILLDEYCIKGRQLKTAKRKEKTRLVYLRLSYRRTMITLLSDDYNSVLIVLTWAFVNKVSVTEYMR